MHDASADAARAVGASDADEDAAEGRVYTVSGEDWDEMVAAANEARGFESGERLVINMGPQHPSTHGVLRLILTLEGETVTEVRASIGYLHTGIEKNMEYRTWTQGVTFCTRMDYLMPFFNETAYCLAVERLLGIEDQIPERAQIIRVMMMELNRISSHLQGIGPMGMELGATTIFLQGLRDARAHPRPVRADHRPADEPRLHPAGRRVAGPAAGRARGHPRVPRTAPRGSSRTCAR